jgi:ubiquinone/menaquinone biosynthesis C-methylase UbiE
MWEQIAKNGNCFKIVGITMSGIKNYDKEVDFFHHEDEFKRCIEIIDRYCDLKDKFVLDVGAGTGLHTGFLVNTGCKFYIGIDMQDYEFLWNGNFKKQLIDHYNSFGVDFDPSKCQFIKMNAEEMLFKDELFDFVISINAFEHIGDPEKALYEIYRVLKKGGYAFIQFDPVYFCDTGSHMFDFVNEPWEHLVHEEKEYLKMLRKAGTPQDIIDDFIFGINKKPKKYYDDLFETIVKNGMFKKICSYSWSGVFSDEHLSHKNFTKLLETYAKEDLLFRGMNILIKKNARLKRSRVIPSFLNR